MKSIRHFSPFQHLGDRLEMFIRLQSQGLCAFFHIPHLQSDFVGENLVSMLDFVLPLILKVCSGVHYCLNSLILFPAFQH